MAPSIPGLFRLLNVLCLFCGVGRRAFGAAQENTTSTIRCEDQLKARLFAHYRPDTPPNRYHDAGITTSTDNYSTSNTTTPPVEVELGIAIRAVQELDSLSGTQLINVWLRERWVDPRLRWGAGGGGAGNSSASRRSAVAVASHLLRENVELQQACTQSKVPSMMLMPVDSRFGEVAQPIWTPDIYIHNTAEKPMSEIENGVAQVFSDGTVKWLRPGMLKATCKFDVKNFPEDTQSCFLEFSSWVYDVSMLVLKPYGAEATWDDALDLSYLDASVEWQVRPHYVHLKRSLYGCCPDPFETVRFAIMATRRPQFYYDTFHTPAFGIMLIGFSAVFIPVAVGERITFSVTMVLSQVLFLVMVSEHLPRGAERSSLTDQMFWMLGVSAMWMLLMILFSQYQVRGWLWQYILSHGKKAKQGKQVKQHQIVSTHEQDHATAKEGGIRFSETTKLSRTSNSVKVLNETESGSSESEKRDPAVLL